jgi:hypothetical protein
VVTKKSVSGSHEAATKQLEQKISRLLGKLGRKDNTIIRSRATQRERAAAELKKIRARFEKNQMPVLEEIKKLEDEIFPLIAELQELTKKKQFQFDTGKAGTRASSRVELEKDKDEKDIITFLRDHGLVEFFKVKTTLNRRQLGSKKPAVPGIVYARGEFRYAEPVPLDGGRPRPHKRKV